MKVTEIFSHAQELGVRIELARDGCLEISPANRTPGELVAAVRARRYEVKKYLLAQASALHLAKQVLLGEFAGCDVPTRLRAAKILRDHISEPLVRAALAHLYGDRTEKKK